MTYGRMQVQRTVCLVTVQEDGDRNDRNVSECQCDCRNSPPRQVKHAGENEQFHACHPSMFFAGV
jgi:hypothetical protein